MQNSAFAHIYRATLCVHAELAGGRCLSSVTLVYCIQKAKDIVKLLFQPGNSIILVLAPKRRYPIPRETPGRGRKIHGVEKIATFN